MTNFEWIKNMDKDALSDLLYQDYCCFYCTEKLSGECNHNCLHNIKDWLGEEHRNAYIKR